MDRLILASQSPARRELLEKLGWPFEVMPSSIDEPAHPELSPKKRASELARLKAQDIAAKQPNRWVIGCDTLVEAHDGTLLEKPEAAADVERMLRLQSGATSLVHSALCLIAPDGTLREDIDSSLVTFAPLSEEDIAWWVGSKNWQGRSGGFQIDGPGQLLIARLEGDWSAVVGLPVHLLGKFLRELGWQRA